MRLWAQTVARLLRPHGRLFLRDGHPVLWSIDEERTDALVLTYPYFEQIEPVRFDSPGTYVETDVVFTNTESREWNHGLGEVVTALLELVWTSPCSSSTTPCPGRRCRDACTARTESGGSSRTAIGCR